MSNTAERTHFITAEPVTPEAFAPFGRVIAPSAASDLEYDLYEGKDDTRLGPVIECDHPTETLILRSVLREFRVRYLERHVEIEQAFLPLSGQPFVSAVAAPDAPLENGLPALDSVRAFFVPAGTGLVIHRGTWHEPPFPLSHGQVTLVTSHRALTEALGSERDENDEINHGDVEKRNVTGRTGVELRIALP